MSVLLALALLAGQGLLALICILLLLTAGMTRLWDRWSLMRVTYQRELSQPRAFLDDEVELVIRIVESQAAAAGGAVASAILCRPRCR